MISCILKEKIVDRSEQGQPHKKRIPNGSQIRQFCRYLRKNRVINELTKILGQSSTFLEVAPNIVEWKPIFQGTLTCFCGKTPKNSDFNRLVPFEYQGPTLRCLTLKFRNLAQLWIRFSWDCSGATKSRVFFSRSIGVVVRILILHLKGPQWKLYLYSICQKWTNKMHDSDEIDATKRTKLIS